jgi:hypothetical protein
MNGWIILKLILKKQGEKGLNGLIWLRTGVSGGLF